MQIQPQHLDLYAAIDTFCAANHMSKSAFGLKAVGDPSLVTDIKRGRELRGATVRKVQQFIMDASAKRVAS